MKRAQTRSELRASTFSGRIDACVCFQTVSAMATPTAAATSTT